MLECETTDAGEPLSISTAAHASNRILTSFVTVTVDTTRHRPLFSIRCGRVSSHVTCSHIWGGLEGSLRRSVLSQPHVSECLPPATVIYSNLSGTYRDNVTADVHAGSIAHP